MGSDSLSVSKSLGNLRSRLKWSELQDGMFRWTSVSLALGLLFVSTNRFVELSDLVRALLFWLSNLVSLVILFHSVVKPLRTPKKTFRSLLREIELTFPVNGERVLEGYRLERDREAGEESSRAIQLARDELELIDRDRLLKRYRKPGTLWLFLSVCCAWLGYGLIRPLPQPLVEKPIQHIAPPLREVQFPEIRRSIFHIKSPENAGGGLTQVPGPPEALKVLPESEVTVELEFFGNPEQVIWKVNQQEFALVKKGGRWKTTVKLVGEGTYEVLANVSGNDAFLPLASARWHTPEDRLPQVAFDVYRSDSEVVAGERLLFTVEASDEVGLESISLVVGDSEYKNVPLRELHHWDGKGAKRFQKTTSVRFDHLSWPPGEYAFFVQAQDSRGSEGMARSAKVMVKVTAPESSESDKALSILLQDEALLKNAAAMHDLQEKVGPPAPGTSFEYQFQEILTDLRKAQAEVKLEGVLQESSVAIQQAFNSVRQGLLGVNGQSVESSLVAVAQGSEIVLDGFVGRFLKVRIPSLQHPEKSLAVRELEVLDEHGKPLLGTSIQRWKAAPRTLRFRKMSDLVSLTNNGFLEMSIAASGGAELPQLGGKHPVPLGEFFETQDHSESGRAYLSQHLVLPAATQLEVAFGGQGTMRLWVNRKLVGQIPEPRGLDGALFKVPLDLIAGENELVLEVGNQGDGADFLFQLSSENQYMNVKADGSLFASGVPVVVATSAADLSSKAGALMDGNLETEWISKASDPPEFLLDLGAVRNVSRLVLHTGSNRIIGEAVLLLEHYNPLEPVASALGKAQALQESNVNALVAELGLNIKDVPSPHVLVKLLCEVASEESESLEDDLVGRFSRYAEVSRLYQAYQSLKGRDSAADQFFDAASEWLDESPRNTKAIRDHVAKILRLNP